MPWKIILLTLFFSIWMTDVAAELAAVGHISPLEMVGFDISPAQFPKIAVPGTKFVVADLNKGFPEEYHNSFDLVHVRFIVFALTVDQIKPAVENLVKLLSKNCLFPLAHMTATRAFLITIAEPGGYIEWTDYTYHHGPQSLYPDGPEGLSSKAEGEMLFAFQAEQKWSPHLAGDVEEALKDLPMEDVRVTDHTDAPHRRPEIRELLTEWHACTVPAKLGMALLRKGTSKEETKRITEAYREKAMKMGKSGVVFQMTITTLIARKKSNLFSDTGSAGTRSNL